MMQFLLSESTFDDYNAFFLGAFISGFCPFLWVTQKIGLMEMVHGHFHLQSICYKMEMSLNQFALPWGWEVYFSYLSLWIIFCMISTMGGKLGYFPRMCFSFRTYEMWQYLELNPNWQDQKEVTSSTSSDSRLKNYWEQQSVGGRTNLQTWEGWTVKFWKAFN